MLKLGLKQALLLLFIVTYIFTKAQNNWPGLKYSYAKAYLYNLQSNLLSNHKIIKSGQLDSTVSDEGKILSSEHISLLNRLFSENFYILSNGISSCYIPHHAIVFYDEKNTPVASLSVCFACEAIRFYHPIKKDKVVKYNKKTEEIALAQLEKLKKIFIDLGYPVFKNTEDYKNYKK